MEIIDPSIRFILFLQSLGDWFIALMQFFTFLGNEEFFLVAAPLIYWCVEARLGARIGLYLMGGVVINEVIKLAYHLPRPYWLFPEVRAFDAQPSFAHPSNHAQIAMTIWGRFAAWVRYGWTWIVFLILVFLIGISRMALGVHFASNVILGWVIGALTLAVVIGLESRIAAWFKRQPVGVALLAVLVVSLLLLAVPALAYQALSGWELPAEWVENARRATPDAEPINPVTLSGAITGAGGFFGMAAGLVLIKKAGGFNAGGPFWQRLLRFVLGIVGLIIIWMGLGNVFPRGESLVPYVLRFLRYALVGLWAGWLAPLLFLKLRLASQG